MRKEVLTDKVIVCLITIFVIASFAVLFAVERVQSSPLAGKDWWSVSFVSPLEPTSEILIENYTTDHTTFRYEIQSEGGARIRKEGSVNVEKGSSEVLSDELLLDLGATVIFYPADNTNDLKTLWR